MSARSARFVRQRTHDDCGVVAVWNIVAALQAHAHLRPAERNALPAPWTSMRQLRRALLVPCESGGKYHTRVTAIQHVLRPVVGRGHQCASWHDLRATMAFHTAMKQRCVALVLLRSPCADDCHFVVLVPSPHSIWVLNDTDMAVGHRGGNATAQEYYHWGVDVKLWAEKRWLWPQRSLEFAAVWADDQPPRRAKAAPPTSATSRSVHGR